MKTLFITLMVVFFAWQTVLAGNTNTDSTPVPVASAVASKATAEEGNKAGTNIFGLPVVPQANYLFKAEQALERKPKKPWSLISDWSLQKMVVDAPYRYGLDTAEYPLFPSLDSPSDKTVNIVVAIISRYPLDCVGGEEGEMTVGLKFNLYRW